MSAPDFDARAKRFTAELQIASNWKHNFYGSVYSTRIKAAIQYAEEAIARAKQLLADDGDPFAQIIIPNTPAQVDPAAGNSRQTCVSGSAGEEKACD